MGARILIAEEVAIGRIQWRARLTASHYHLIFVEDMNKVADTARLDSPDVVVLSGNNMAAMLSHCQRLKSQDVTADVPVVIVGNDAEPDARLAALAAGADELLATPLRDQVCLARIRSLLRARDTQAELVRRRSTAEEFGFCEAAVPFDRPGSVALVARSRTLGLDWRDALVGKIRDRIVVLGEHAALSTAQDLTAADVYVIDIGADRPEEGLRLLADLRARAETRRASVLAVVHPSDPDAAVHALDLGASDLIQGDFLPDELAMRVQTQLRVKKETDMLTIAVEDGMRLAATDALTGLYNRRYAMTHATRILNEAATAARPVALLLGDLDHFKGINDTYGHAAGDTVLTEVAARLKANLRGADVLARIGGEEFLIVMSDTNLDRAAAVAGRVCETIAAHPIAVNHGKVCIPVTMSIGVVATDGSAERLENLLDRADRALYASKSAGRNQITVAAAA